MKFDYIVCLKSKKVAILIAYISLPFILYFLPLDWLNKQHTICLIKNIFGIECPGCGITRAIISAVQLDIVKALEYNKIVILVLPIFVYRWFKNIIKIYNKPAHNSV